MGKNKKCQTRTVFFSMHEQSRVGSWAHDRAFCTSACMLRVVEAIKRELGLPNEIDGAVPMIINADNAVMAHGYRA